MIIYHIFHHFSTLWQRTHINTIHAVGRHHDVSSQSSIIRCLIVLVDVSLCTNSGASFFFLQKYLNFFQKIPAHFAISCPRDSRRNKKHKKIFIYKIIFVYKCFVKTVHFSLLNNRGNERQSIQIYFYTFPENCMKTYLRKLE